METHCKIFSFAAVKIKSIHIKFAGFVLLLGLMFFLNNRIEKANQAKEHQTETVVTIELNHSGIAPLMAQIPHEHEGSLPIKLITNLNSNFLYFINNGYEFRNQFSYLQLKKQFLIIYPKIQKRTLIKYLIAAKSKDIQ